MAYILSNICSKNYWYPTTIVEIVVGGWVVYFFETPCSICCVRVPMYSFCYGRPM